jgi:DNA repair and recombination protein RAD54 and RAD54-like protein
VDPAHENIFQFQQSFPILRARRDPHHTPAPPRAKTLPRFASPLPAMPTPPVSGRARGKPNTKVISEICSNEDGGSARGEDSVTGGGGEGLNLIKPEPVDGVGINTEVVRGRGRALALVHVRSENPTAPPPRKQTHRRRAPPLPIAAAGPSRQPQPEVIYISSSSGGDDDEESRGFRSRSPPQKVFLTKGSGHGERRVNKEPFDGSGYRARSSAAGTRAVVWNSAPGSSTEKRKRKIEFPNRFRPHKRGDNGDGCHVGGRGVMSSNSGASGTGRCTTGTEDGTWAHSALVDSDDTEDGEEQDQRLRRHSAWEMSGSVQHASKHSVRAISVESGKQRGPVQHASKHTARAISVESGKQQGPEQHASDHFAGAVSDDSNGEEEEEEEEEVENQDVAAAVEEQQEKEGNNELEKQEDGSEEDSHSLYEEDGEEESAGSDEGSDGAEVAQARAPSNAMTAGSARSEANSTRTFKKRIFEGICIPEKPDKTVDEGIVGRTRSKRKCTNRKLLKCGFFSRPVKIDVSDSSESEEEVLPLVQTQQGLLSSSEDYSNEARPKHRRKNRKGEKKPSDSRDDEYQVKVGKYQRRSKGHTTGNRLKFIGQKPKGGKAYDGLRYSGPNGGKEGGKAYGGHRYSGQKGEHPMNMSNAQDDLSFKKHAGFGMMRKHQTSRAKAAYDELFDSLFAQWDNHTNAPADAQNGSHLPLMFSFGDEDNVEDKSDNEKFMDELWRDFDVALDSNIGTHVCEEVLFLLRD